MKTTVAALAALAAAVLVGCGADHIVTTASSPPAPETTTVSRTPAPTVTAANLVDAATYYRRTAERAGYYFTTPSGRWACVIVARRSAGCQSTAGTALPVSGAPDTVLDPAGEQVAPNTVVVDRAGEGRFAWQQSADFAPTDSAAVVLPFGAVLAVAGFRCTVAEATGIACRSDESGRGFTFSAEGYTLQYTEAPPP